MRTCERSVKRALRRSVGGDVGGAYHAVAGVPLFTQRGRLGAGVVALIRGTHLRAAGLVALDLQVGDGGLVAVVLVQAQHIAGGAVRLDDRAVDGHAGGGQITRAAVAGAVAAGCPQALDAVVGLEVAQLDGAALAVVLEDLVIGLGGRAADDRALAGGAAAPVAGGDAAAGAAATGAGAAAAAPPSLTTTS